MNRKLIFGVFAILLVAGWLALRSLPFTGTKPAQVQKQDTAAVSADGATRTKTPATQVLMELANRSVADQVVVQRAVPVKISADKVLRDQMLDLFHLARDVNVTPEEAARIADRYSFYQTVRGAFEAEIATITPSDGKLSITIPPYPKAGEELRSMFLADFKQTLGDERGEKAFGELQSTFDSLFRGFGADEQALDIQYQGKFGSGDDTYRVVRQQMAPSPRSVPGNKDFTFTGATSTATVASSQLDSGEFAYLAPFLRQITPGN